MAASKGSKSDTLKSTWETEYNTQFEWKTVFERPKIRKPYLYPAPPEIDDDSAVKNGTANPKTLSSRFRNISQMTQRDDGYSTSNYGRHVSGESFRGNRSTEMTLDELEKEPSRGRSRMRRQDKPLASNSRKVPIQEDDAFEEEEFDPEIVNNILSDAQKTLRKSRSCVTPREIIKAEQLLDKYTRPFQTEYNDSFSTSQASLLKNLAEPYFGESRDTERLSRRFKEISLEREMEATDSQINSLLALKEKERKTLKKLKKLEKQLLKKTHDEGLGASKASDQTARSSKSTQANAKASHGIDSYFVTKSNGKLSKPAETVVSGVKEPFDYRRTFSVRRTISPPPPRNVFHGVSNATVRLDAFPTFERIAKRTVKPAHHREKRHFPTLQALDQTVEVFHPSKYVYQNDWKV